MERRALVRGLLLGIPASAAVMAGAAAKSKAYVRETSEHSIDALKSQVEALRKRIDETDASTKKWLKTLTALTLLSLGLDFSALL